MTKTNKLLALDGIEILTVRQQKSDFPEHYHDTFCISWIERGIEAIKMGNSTLYTEPGSISINNPFEIHANPILDQEVANDFTTIYLSPGLVDFFLEDKNVLFKHQQLKNDQAIYLFKQVTRAIACSDIKQLEFHLRQLLNGFEKISKRKVDEIQYPDIRWAELILFIEENLKKNIKLELLASVTHLNKFSFSKQFRARFGMSPINYVLMKKVFAAKSKIQADTDLTALAYEFSFFDQAHFSRTFKRFVGVSPKNYKRQMINRSL